MLEPRVLYGERDDFDEPDTFRLPLGKAEIVAPGKDATIVTCGAMVRVAASGRRERARLDAEVIDLLTLWPWDRKTVLDSVRKTGRLVTVEEAPPAAAGAPTSSQPSATEAFGALKAPPLRITLPDAPVPYNGDLEARFLPSPDYVAEQTAALISSNRAPAPWWRKAS